MPPRSTDAHPSLKEVIPWPLDQRVVSIMVLTALLLTASHYYGHYGRSLPWITSLLNALGMDDALAWMKETFSVTRNNPRGELHQRQFWAGAHVLLYLVIPALVVKLAFGQKLSEYGLKVSGWHRKMWVYLAAFAVVLPLVWWVRGSPAFQATYPFYKNAHQSWADFLAWELPYCLQFLALEFFFRGVLIHGLKHRFGFYSVLIMTIPYCMIHFGKPPLETLGAIFAGIFLGTLSLWTRSIWLGTLIHISVAVSMDLAAMQYRGQLINLFG